MADRTVRFTVSLSIPAEKADAFERTALSMIEGTRKEPGALQYDWYLSSDRTQCRLLETYADGAAVVAHLTGPVVRDLVPKLLQTATLTGFEVYGDAGQKGDELLANLRARLFKPWHALKA